MKKIIWNALSVLTIATLASGTVAPFLAGAARSAFPERYIVTFDHPVNAAAQNALENAGGQVLGTLTLVNGMTVLLPSQAAVHRVGASQGVVRVEKDAEVYATGRKPSPSATPAPQPAQTLEWGVDRIDADLVPTSTRGVGVDVAVIDTGIDATHPDLTANIAGGVNFVSKSFARPADSTKWNDDNGHGTHVAGIIAAADNAVGVIGVAPQANLWAVKVLDRNGSGYTSNVIKGIEWSIDNGIEVINMSLGSSSDVQALHDAVDAAVSSGVTVVAAAGNSGDGIAATNNVEYPGKYESVIAVAATDVNDNVPYWSSDGEEVDIAAPGVAIRSTWMGSTYNTISGTSMATPHVAGVAALVMGSPTQAAYDADLDGIWDPAEVRAVLEATADDLGIDGFDVFYGHGLVDAEEAVTGFETVL